jgi:hypothetical protein
VAGYQIADEPAPTSLARFAVNPIFPLLASMIGGVWIAWPWFAFNSIAVGSPTLRSELAWLGTGLVVMFAAAAAIVLAVGAGILPVAAARYAFVCVAVMKLAFVYAVYVRQARTIEIYAYYGGVLRNGVLVLVLLFVIGNAFLDALPIIPRVVLL